jgi:hypothetical protein
MSAESTNPPMMARRAQTLRTQRPAAPAALSNTAILPPWRH